MKSTNYSDKVMDHFRNPRNSGHLEGEDVAVGRVGNPVCGDLMEVYLKVNDNKIDDIKFKTFGCGSAIATASMVTELAKGRSLQDASKISRNEVAQELDGLPPIKMHCSNLAADALHDAIKKFNDKEKQDSHVSDNKNALRKLIKGESEYDGKGVYYDIEDPVLLKDQRVILVENGKKSLELALTLTTYTPRVILITTSRDLSAYKDLDLKIKMSNVKILYESELLKVSGFNEVEKVLVHNLDEGQEYDLFVDSLVLV